MINALLVGGEQDGAWYQFPDPDDQPRPAILMPVPESVKPWQWRDLINAVQPVATRVGVYELVLAEDGLPSRADDGSYRYDWKGIH